MCLKLYCYIVGKKLKTCYNVNIKLVEEYEDGF